MSEDDDDSPCVGVCMYDIDAEICIGCWRTLDEIGEWSSMSKQERKEAMAVIAIRKINEVH